MLFQYLTFSLLGLFLALPSQATVVVDPVTCRDVGLVEDAITDARDMASSEFLIS